eukprot:m.95480 g.95480  ORF g.95480 m.95480 type:complete len:161 (+) comp13494_c0_seq1:83-565(+)
MAGNSQRKLLQGNKASLSFHGLMILVSLVLHFLIRVFYFGEMLTMHWVGTWLSVGMVSFSYFFMYMGAGKGADLSMKDSIFEYAKDIIYIGSASLTLTCLSDYFYLLWILVLLFIIYKITGYLQNWLFPPAGPGPTAADIKRERKKERQAELFNRRAKGK